ncbi:MAG TPA: MFS transporter, partial [Pirellulales bacterium]
PLRWLNGLGNGLLLASGMVLVWKAFPRHRELAMALYGMAVFVPAAAGSVIGGLLTALQSWRWIFLVNLPAGAIVFSLAWSLLPRPTNQQPRAPVKFDLVGVGFLLSSIVTVSVVLDLGQYWGWATSREFSLWFVGLLASIAGFVCWGLFAKKPLFDFSVFRIRNAALGLLIKILFSINFYSLATMLSVYMIDLRGYQWWQAALVILPAVVSMLVSTVFGILIGEESNRRGRMFVGLAIMILSTWQLTVLDLYTSKFWLAAVLGIWGLGAGLVVGPALGTIFGGLTIDETITLAGIFNICRALPGYIATVALVTLWTQSTDAHFDTLRQNVRFNRPIVSSTYDTAQGRFADRGSPHDQSLDQSHAMIAQWTHANARAFALEDVLGDLALITSPALICVLLVQSPRHCHVKIAIAAPLSNSAI